MNRGLQQGLNRIGKDKTAPVLGNILVKPLALPNASSEDNDVGIDEVDHMGEGSCKALFISGHGALGQRFTSIRRRHDFGTRPTFSPDAKIIRGQPGT